MDTKEAQKLVEVKAARENYSKNTIDDYKGKLSKLASYFRDTAIEDVTLPQLQEYLYFRAKREKRSYSTIHGDRAAFQFFYNRVLEKNYDFKSISNPAIPIQNAPVLLSKDEVTKLLEATETTGDRLMFALMYHFELRGVEVVQLRIEDFIKQNDGGKALRITSRQRLEKLHNSLGKELQDYLAKNKPTKWMFVTRWGNQVYNSSLSRTFHDALRAAGIHKKLTTTSLSTSHAEHISQFGDVLIEDVLRSNTSKTPENFVDPEQIDRLRQIECDDFDLAKLIRLCEELNGCYAKEWYYAAAILQRAILDHVPPIFDPSYEKFTDVVEKYNWRAFKRQMDHLQKFARDTANDAVHGRIRSSEVLLNKTQFDTRIPLSTLLNEIIRLLRMQE
jgi:site-specific recombinase XerD